jgi:hypothetical protein
LKCSCVVYMRSKVWTGNQSQAKRDARQEQREDRYF